VACHGYGKNVPCKEASSLKKSCSSVILSLVSASKTHVGASVSMWPVSYQKKVEIDSSQNFLFQVSLGGA
jgi:hypothetical protein